MKLSVIKISISKRFAFDPEIKACINGDIVTVLEIGDINREIVYRGDLSNTAARIQDKCNGFN